MTEVEVYDKTSALFNKIFPYLSKTLNGPTKNKFQVKQIRNSLLNDKTESYNQYHYIENDFYYFHLGYKKEFKVEIQQIATDAKLALQWFLKFLEDNPGYILEDLTKNYTLMERFFYELFMTEEEIQITKKACPSDLVYWLLFDKPFSAYLEDDKTLISYIEEHPYGNIRMFPLNDSYDALAGLKTALGKYTQNADPGLITTPNGEEIRTLALKDYTWTQDREINFICEMKTHTLCYSLYKRLTKAEQLNFNTQNWPQRIYRTFLMAYLDPLTIYQRKESI